MSLMNRVRKNLREWYTLAADRTGEMAKVSSRRYDKFGLSREIERQFSELGSYVYHAIGEGRAAFADDPAVAGIVARIQGLERDLEVKDREIEVIRQTRQHRAPEPAGEGEARPTAPAADAPSAAPSAEPMDAPGPAADDDLGSGTKD